MDGNRSERGRHRHRARTDHPSTVGNPQWSDGSSDRPQWTPPDEPRSWFDKQAPSRTSPAPDPAEGVPGAGDRWRQAAADNAARWRPASDLTDTAWGLDGAWRDPSAQWNVAGVAPENGARQTHAGDPRLAAGTQAGRPGWDGGEQRWDAGRRPAAGPTAAAALGRRPTGPGRGRRPGRPGRLGPGGRAGRRPRRRPGDRAGASGAGTPSPPDAGSVTATAPGPTGRAGTPADRAGTPAPAGTTGPAGTATPPGAPARAGAARPAGTTRPTDTAWAAAGSPVALLERPRGAAAPDAPEPAAPAPERKHAVRHPLRIGLFALVLFGLVAGSVAWLSMDKSVTLTVDGEARAVKTYASTVGGVLDDQKHHRRRARHAGPGPGRPGSPTAPRSCCAAAGCVTLTVDGQTRAGVDHRDHRAGGAGPDRLPAGQPVDVVGPVDPAAAGRLPADPAHAEERHDRRRRRQAHDHHDRGDGRRGARPGRRRRRRQRQALPAVDRRRCGPG